MRPQRQARSSVSYAESVSDDDDDDFAVLPARSSARRRPERESRSSAAAHKKKARPNPKERAEAMQLERAIRESLNEVTAASETSTASLVSSSLTNPSIAFQCLLDVTYEEGRSRGFERQEPSEAVDVGDLSKQHKPTGVGDLTNQQEPVDVDDLAKVHEPYVEHEEDRLKHQDAYGAQVQEDIPDSSESRGGNEAEEKGTHASIHRRLRKRRMNEGEDVPLLETAGETTKLKKSGCSSASPDELLTPTSLPQRRVVGLSRRFRPPSLHPYLTS